MDPRQKLETFEGEQEQRRVASRTASEVMAPEDRDVGAC